MSLVRGSNNSASINILHGWRAADSYAATSRTRVISDGAPKRLGGPQ